MTAISLPGVWGAGYAVHGKSSIADMLGLIRAHAFSQKQMAEAVLAASDNDFLVETYVGVHVRKNREVLQTPSSASETADQQVGTPAQAESPGDEAKGQKP